jgi:hypothetical protein
MSELTTPAPAATTAPGPLRAVARWMVTFVGFPVGGLTTDLLVGPVNSPVRALLGGCSPAASSGWRRRGASAATARLPPAGSPPPPSA